MKLSRMKTGKAAKKMLVKEGMESLIGNHPSDLEREQSIQV